MNNVIYEQVAQNTENSFFYRRCTSWYKSAIGYHQHPELEIGFVIKGGGQRITDDFIENFREGDIIIVPANIPHCWIYDKLACPADERIEEAFIQFPQAFLNRLASFQRISRYRLVLHQSETMFVDTRGRSERNTSHPAGFRQLQRTTTTFRIVANPCTCFPPRLQQIHRPSCLQWHAHS